MFHKLILFFKFTVSEWPKMVQQFSISRLVVSHQILNKKLQTNGNRGFALLITLVVVSVVLAIGLSLLFVTTKQYLLAITAIESEKAFQAAQIGLECMRYHREQPVTRAQLLRESGNWPPALSCAGVSPNTPPGIQATTLFNDSGRLLYNYKYQYNINTNQCAEPSIYIADLRNATVDLIYTVTGEGLGTIECKAGTLCTVVFGRGYNRPCNQLNSIYTIQREITVEY